MVSVVGEYGKTFVGWQQIWRWSLISMVNMRETNKPPTQRKRSEHICFRGVYRVVGIHEPTNDFCSHEYHLVISSHLGDIWFVTFFHCGQNSNPRDFFWEMIVFKIPLSIIPKNSKGLDVARWRTQSETAPSPPARSTNQMGVLWTSQVSERLPELGCLQFFQEEHWLTKSMRNIGILWRFLLL